MIAVGFHPMQLSQLPNAASGSPERSLVIRQINDGRVRAASHHTESRLSAGTMPDHPVVLAARQAQAGRLEFVSD